MQKGCTERNLKLTFPLASYRCVYYDKYIVLLLWLLHFTMNGVNLHGTLRHSVPGHLATSPHFVAFLGGQLLILATEMNN